MDRRVKYTKNIIRETLLDLMESKDITKITVTEICEIADVNRATFYKYYLDVYDLLNQIEEELMNDIKKSLTIDNIKNMDLKEILLNILKIVEEKEDICRVILGDNGNKEFLINILYYARDVCFDMWRKSFTDLQESKFNYLFMYGANGVLADMQLWVKNGCIEPVEEIADLICELVRKGNRGFLK